MYKRQQIPSITEYSAALKINPATALKGINLLVDAGLVYKKRGVGMFVAEGAREALLAKRREGFYESQAKPAAREAKALGITLDELKGSWIARANTPCIFISARERTNIDKLREDLYGMVREIHAGRYPFNNFLY
mgnify:CR=1 FL=1